MSRSTLASDELGALSLLSLSASSAQAIPIPAANRLNSDAQYGSLTATPNTRHRGLSSTGKSKRRMSDARESATRPAMSTPLSLSTLTLSSSPRTTASVTSMPPSERPYVGQYGATPFVGSPYSTRGASAMQAERTAKGSTPVPEPEPIAFHPKGSKHKRGASTFICESCSKVYRHPSCLIKHRWEHTPHWQDSSSISKHQQVQLLEAAAILSHLDPAASTTGTSLPEDRSLWPSFVSPGAIPMPASHNKPTGTPFQLSSSVPSGLRPSSSPRPSSNGGGPRMHDYAIPKSASPRNGITQLRPGLLGVPTGVDSPRTVYNPNVAPASVPVSVGAGGMHQRRLSSSPAAAGGWSLPQSSLRSVATHSGRTHASSFSRSRSGSGSRSEDEDAELPEIGDDEQRYEHSSPRYGYSSRGRWKDEFSVREEDEDMVVDATSKKAIEPLWDGGELDMDMD